MKPNIVNSLNGMHEKIYKLMSTSDPMTIKEIHQLLWQRGFSGTIPSIKKPLMELLQWGAIKEIKLKPNARSEHSTFIKLEPKKSKPKPKPTLVEIPPPAAVFNPESPAKKAATQKSKPDMKQDTDATDDPMEIDAMLEGGLEHIATIKQHMIAAIDPIESIEKLLITLSTRWESEKAQAATQNEDMEKLRELLNKLVN